MTFRRTAGVLLGCAVFAAAPSRHVRAAEGPLSGQWVHKADGVRVLMTFGDDGRCSATASGPGKAAALDGTYKLGPGEVVVTAAGGKPVTYSLAISGDRMVLSGGDLEDGQRLELSRRDPALAPAGGAASPAPAPARPALAARPETLPPGRPLAADDKGAEKPAAEEAKLPAGMRDTKAFEQYWSIARVKLDPVRNEVTWILEAKANFSSSSLSLAVTYFDEDEVRMEMAPASCTVTFQPQGGNFKKGERFRAVLVLPKDEQMQKVKSVKIAPPSSDYTRPATR